MKETMPNIKLVCNYDKRVNIPKLILPRNEYIMINKYDIIKESNIDLHIVIYAIDEYHIKIIIRRLDEEHGWEDNLKLILYDNNVANRREFISIGKSEQNYKYIFKNTKIQLLSDTNHDYQQEIPKIIFQTGHGNNLKSILHFNSIISFIELNPEYTYIYYNDTDARIFLRQNFSDEINYSYDLLVPGAFKADLLRYCFLYHMGGCYFDCKQILRIPIKSFLEPTKQIVLCNDVIGNALLNAVILSTKKHIIMDKTIKDCVYNIINKLGQNALDITGPIFFYKSIKKFIKDTNILLQNNRPPDNFNDFCNDYINNNITLKQNNKVILNRFYKNYYNNYLDTTHYGVLYNNNEVYYKNFQLINKYKFFIYPNKYNDTFIFSIKSNNKISIKRSDSTDGWYFDLKVLIIDEKFIERSINVGMSITNTKEIEIDV